MAQAVRGEPGTAGGETIAEGIAVKTPGIDMLDRMAAIEDLAILTGGQPLIQEAGQTLKNIKGKGLTLGRVRRAWADSTGQ